jgi:RsiW-degrading membrane proteinase PrsW (M82 family)
MRDTKHDAPSTWRSSNSTKVNSPQRIPTMTLGFKKTLAPDDRMLRQFATLWIIFFGAIALVQEFHNHRHVLALVLGILAATIGPLGLIWPRAIKPVFIGWMVLVFPIGWTISHVMLGILFYGLFSPVGLLFRITGRDALALKPQRNAATYWQPKPQAEIKSQYLRQF